jgi:hypothetical protein
VSSVARATYVLAALATSQAGTAQDGSYGQADTVKIRINVAGSAITAALENNATARDFVSILPLTITLEDYASTEKIADLPRRLNTEDAPAGIDPSVGDITYYAPWGNLAIFYRDFGYANGLVKIGTIEAGVETLQRTSRIRATIELIEK